MASNEGRGGATVWQVGGYKMEIITRGIDPKENIYRGICHRCKSVMEEVAGKLKIITDQREGGTFAHADCPVCRHDFILYPKKG